MSKFEVKQNFLFDLTWNGSIYCNIRLSCVQIVETTTPDTRLLGIVQQCKSRNSQPHEFLAMANKYNIYSAVRPPISTK